MILLLVIIYLAFIGLGLPDAVLGSAWPVMHLDLNSNLPFAGVIALVISLATVISSLSASMLTHRLGTATVVLISILVTASALYGIAFTQNTHMLILLSFLLGLGAGAVDAVLNNFVAIHYQSKHMNYLHSFWGIGATAGPLIMAMYLAQDQGWRDGYTSISYIQFALGLAIFLSMALWKIATQGISKQNSNDCLVPNIEALKIKGVKIQLLMFFCYCALEASTGLWAASYLTKEWGASAIDAAFWTAMFFLGITIGRFCCGLLASYIEERKIIEIAVLVMYLGVILLLIPLSFLCAKIGLILIGLGCAPIYPNTIHLTPCRYNKGASQTIIGLSMACAYLGSTLMPALLGGIASATSFIAIPIALLFFTLIIGWTTLKLRTCDEK